MAELAALVDFATEFNGTSKAGEYVKILLAKGIDPSTLIESTEDLRVSYNVEFGEDEDTVRIVKDVSLKGRNRNSRYTFFYDTVAEFSREGATELAVDLLRLLAVS
jgi:hypothetical protein